MKGQLKFNSEARASTLLHERKIPHFASPNGYPPIEEPTPSEVTKRRRQQAQMVRTTLDFQVSEKKRLGYESRKAEKDRHRVLIDRGLKDIDNEVNREKEKMQKYKQEIVTVWDRTNKLAEVKRRLEHDLGIAINDDKIKFLMRQQNSQYAT